MNENDDSTASDNHRIAMRIVNYETRLRAVLEEGVELSDDLAKSRDTAVWMAAERLKSAIDVGSRAIPNDTSNMARCLRELDDLTSLLAERERQAGRYRTPYSFPGPAADAVRRRSKRA